MVERLLNNLSTTLNLSRKKLRKIEDSEQPKQSPPSSLDFRGTFCTSIAITVPIILFLVGARKDPYLKKTANKAKFITSETSDQKTR